MNKAFVRESDAPPPRCPGCGGPGTGVERRTVEAQVGRDAADRLASDAFYCPRAGCDVAYFDAWKNTVGAEELAEIPYPKRPRGVACACLGVTVEEIVQDAHAGIPDRVRRIVAHARSGAAECATRMPDGVACVSRVRRLFLERRRE